MLHGSTIISDCWKAYIGNEVCQFKHLTVNHSESFVDRHTGAHSQRVESMWNKAKERNRRQWGTHIAHMGHMGSYGPILLYTAMVLIVKWSTETCVNSFMWRQRRNNKNLFCPSDKKKRKSKFFYFCCIAMFCGIKYTISCLSLHSAVIV